MLLLLLVAEAYLQHRHGINPTGYRGPSAGTKKYNEKRIAVLGGSTTWGYGLPWNQTFPAHLERNLQLRRGSGNAPFFSVLNMGYNSQGAYSFKYTLKDYDYLAPDIIVLYSGYNDLVPEPQNRSNFRHDSPVFLATGYMPLLPFFLSGKISALTAAFRNKDDRTVFSQPDLDQQKITHNANVANSLKKQMEESKQNGYYVAPSADNDCAQKWMFYCTQIFDAINVALNMGKRVLVVTEPYLDDRYIDQQRSLRNMLGKRFPNNDNVRYVNLGLTVDLKDPELCWDGMHLTEKGSARIADAVAQALIPLL